MTTFIILAKRHIGIWNIMADEVGAHKTVRGFHWELVD